MVQKGQLCRINSSAALPDSGIVAAAACRKFVSCVEMLPADQAAPLWQVVSAEAAAMCGA